MEDIRWFGPGWFDKVTPPNRLEFLPGVPIQFLPGLSDGAHWTLPMGPYPMEKCGGWNVR